MRAANGHPEPFHVGYWEIGNEIWGDWVRGHSDAETYARNYNRYAAARRAIDPSIHLIAVGDNNMNWNRTVLRLAGSNIGLERGAVGERSCESCKSSRTSESQLES